MPFPVRLFNGLTLALAITGITAVRAGEPRPPLPWVTAEPLSVSPSVLDGEWHSVALAKPDMPAPSSPYWTALDEALAGVPVPSRLPVELQSVAWNAEIFTHRLTQAGRPEELDAVVAEGWLRICAERLRAPLHPAERDGYAEHAWVFWLWANPNPDMDAFAAWLDKHHPDPEAARAQLLARVTPEEGSHDLPQRDRRLPVSWVATPLLSVSPMPPFHLSPAALVKPDLPTLWSGEIKVDPLVSPATLSLSGEWRSVATARPDRPALPPLPPLPPF